MRPSSGGADVLVEMQAGTAVCPCCSHACSDVIARKLDAKAKVTMRRIQTAREASSTCVCLKRSVEALACSPGRFERHGPALQRGQRQRAHQTGLDAAGQQRPHSLEGQRRSSLAGCPSGVILGK